MNFNIVFLEGEGGFRKMIFWVVEGVGWDGGIMKLDILGGYRKTGLFLEVISKYSRAFS